MGDTGLLTAKFPPVEQYALLDSAMSPLQCHPPFTTWLVPKMPKGSFESLMAPQWETGAETSSTIASRLL